MDAGLPVQHRLWNGRRQRGAHSRTNTTTTAHAELRSWSKAKRRKRGRDKFTRHGQRVRSTRISLRDHRIVQLKHGCVLTVPPPHSGQRHRRFLSRFTRVVSQLPPDAFALILIYFCYYRSPSCSFKTSLFLPAQPRLFLLFFPADALRSYRAPFSCPLLRCLLETTQFCRCTTVDWLVSIWKSA